MAHLIPCSGCARHVRAQDSLCPFCGEALPLSLRSREPKVPTQRLGRAATFAFGAAIAGATACGTTVTPADAGPVGTDAGQVEEDAGGVSPLYGGPPIDAGPIGDDAGPIDDDAGPVETDAGPDAGGGIVPAYGAPAYGAPPDPSE